MATRADDVPHDWTQLVAYRTSPSTLFETAGVSREQYLQLCGDAADGLLSAAQRAELRRMYALLRMAAVQQAAASKLHEMPATATVLSASVVSAEEYLACTTPAGAEGVPLVLADIEQTQVVQLRNLVQALPDRRIKVRVYCYSYQCM